MRPNILNDVIPNGVMLVCELQLMLINYVMV